VIRDLEKELRGGEGENEGRKNLKKKRTQRSMRGLKPKGEFLREGNRFGQSRARRRETRPVSAERKSGGTSRLVKKIQVRLVTCPKEKGWGSVKTREPRKNLSRLR